MASAASKKGKKDGDGKKEEPKSRAEKLKKRDDWLDKIQENPDKTEADYWHELSFNDARRRQEAKDWKHYCETKAKMEQAFWTAKSKQPYGGVRSAAAEEKKVEQIIADYEKLTGEKLDKTKALAMMRKRQEAEGLI